MGLSQGIFAIKLYELEQQYGRLQSRLRICQQEHLDRIREERASVEDECRETGLMLQTQVENSRSPAIAAFSAAQMRYYKEIRSLMEQESAKLMQYEGGNPSEEQAEAMTLYAEYAIDFATLSMKQALLAALYAIDLQLTADTKL